MATERGIKITDLNATFLISGGEGVYRRNNDGELIPVPERHGVGIVMDCPCGNVGCPKLSVLFKNPLDGGPPIETKAPLWNCDGDTIENITISPSIKRIGGCAWHGWIKNGRAV